MRRRSPLATTWALATVAGAAAVGVTTQRPGFVVITFVGGLLLPRVLGFGGFGHGHAHGCGGDRTARLDRHLGSWHRAAHGDAGAAAPGGEAA